MKNGKWIGWILAAAMLLTGCKNFWVTSSSSCTTNCTTISSGVFYVLNSNAGQVEITGYSIVNGTMTALAGSPYALASGPYSIAVAPNNNFLYVSTQAGIYLYTIGTGGVLTLSSTVPVFRDFAAYTMKVDATNSWLVEASGLGYLYAIPISPTTGATTGTAQQVTLPGISPHQLVISSDNANVIVALGSTGTAVIPFTAANADPLPASVNAPIAVKTAGTSAISVALDPINRLLYIGEASGTSGSNNGVLRAVSYGSISGNPTEVAGSPFTTGGLSPASILPVASGAYVYVANATVANSSTGNVSGFSLTASGTTYTLTPLGSTASAGVTPASLAEDSTGTVVLLVNSGGSPDLNVYTFDSAVSGKLDSALTSSTGNDPVGALAIAAAP
jgi:hypothetical protein